MTDCTLCDRPTPDPPITDGDGGEYCCRGCLSVARALDDVETSEDDLDERRDTDDIEVPEDAETGYLAVDGMHCGTCEAFLESRAVEQSGVHDAAASYATDTMRVVYDPDETRADDLADTVSGYGYTARSRGIESESEADESAWALALGGFFGMMVMGWYAIFLYPTYFGYDVPFIDLNSLVGLYLFGNVWLLTSIVLFYTGWPTLRGAYVSIRAGHPNMDLLVALAATAAYGYSTVAMLLGRTHLYFDVTVAIVLVVSLGNYYEGRVKDRAVGLLSELTESRVTEARRLTADGTETVPVEQLSAGDRLLVKAGERLPTDGEVVEGSAAVDESLLSGEPMPVEKVPGEEVIGGSVVTDSPLTVEVAADAESTLDRIVELLWSIQSTRPGMQRLADRLATVFVPTVIALGLVAAAWVLLTGGSAVSALLIGLTVLIVSCPCALGLATPLAVAAGIREAADAGIVVVSEAVFEAVPEVDVMVFDKTGTLTTGEMRVAEVVGDDPDVIRDRAAAVESRANHPVATAITESADAPPEATHFERHSTGVSAVVDGDRVTVGRADLLRDEGLSIPNSLAQRAEGAAAAGQRSVFVGWDGQARGLLLLGERERPEAAEVVADLSADHEVVVLTGDESGAVERIEDRIDADEVFAGVPPEAKAETVDRLRSRGTVAMVGDGSNDGPPLAAADLGVALGSGTDLAADAADAVLLDDDLRNVATLFDIANGTHGRIRQNLGWAFLYNGVAIPIAVAGLLNPLFAAVAMTASSLLVVVNSARSLRS
ncbi:copper-translocating P-type ATPase [Halorientalis sp. IM1011]|uniref:heavy metal translocating P-type ATPase n=1 Tax=Halorientalis sp. IM1011 TaxID=1932360 RepID=UPI00097CD6E3|nr:cation-translocating P-type ATPase [Halorientalis sp. IM1011]AQL43909.1 copper-translocating P-type ATPase [Halorientalis sp. IM1011]